MPAFFRLRPISPFTPRRAGRPVRLLLALPVLLMALAARSGGVGTAHAASFSNTAFSLPSYNGMDYYTPSDFFAGCMGWQWLQSGCYTNTGLTATYKTSYQSKLESDIDYMDRVGLGKFQRV